MKGFSFSKKKKGVKESRELHSRKYWTHLLTFFVLALALEMIYFSIYFIHVTGVLDAPATPTLETNATKIKNMEHRLDMVEETLKKRTGTQPQVESSQNTPSVIQ